MLVAEWIFTRLYNVIAVSAASDMCCGRPGRSDSLLTLKLIEKAIGYRHKFNAGKSVRDTDQAVDTATVHDDVVFVYSLFFWLELSCCSPRHLVGCGVSAEVSRQTRCDGADVPDWLDTSMCS
uniref:Secreted protein n=1 Tax=Peronospora matthiolae TaxID=2874970 RepID=A0AAV1UP07_9STRA